MPSPTRLTSPGDRSGVTEAVFRSKWPIRRGDGSSRMRGLGRRVIWDAHAARVCCDTRRQPVGKGRATPRRHGDPPGGRRRLPGSAGPRSVHPAGLLGLTRSLVAEFGPGSQVRSYPARGWPYGFATACCRFLRPPARRRPYMSAIHIVVVDLFFRVAVLVVIIQVIEKLGEHRHPEWVIGEGGMVGQPGSDRGL
jgi:hypothetical protein